MKKFILVKLTCLLLVLGASAAPKPEEIKASVTKAYDFFKSVQKENGSFEPQRAGPGVTAIIVAGLIRNGYPVDDPVVAKGMKYLESQIQEDGGIYNRFLANYTTCIALVTFQEANKSGKYDKVIASANKFIKTLQQGGPEENLPFGGFGYDAKSRPDVSNTHFAVEALIAAGVPKDDPAIQNAIRFLSKCQNLPSEANKEAYAKKASEQDKGGFVYNPSEAGNAKSPKVTPEGGLRSEGAMTYAGLKSFLYAGVGKTDPRVVAALGWIRKNYTLEENPGQGEAGLYYYYTTFAKAMSVLGEDNFEDAAGKKHDWKMELFTTLKTKQSEKGSWTNKNGAFLESSPELATAFAVLALSYCK